jgi:hypothetical protein
VGQHKDFHFDCPNVDPSKTAFLEFQSMDVSHSSNELNINKCTRVWRVTCRPYPNGSGPSDIRLDQQHAAC